MNALTTLKQTAEAWYAHASRKQKAALSALLLLLGMAVFYRLGCNVGGLWYYVTHA